VLDGIRALAVTLVILDHSVIRQRFPGSAVGVDVFFVLSGFLITTLLIREHDERGTISLKKFYARRTLRIWPALYVFLIFFGLWAVTVASPAARDSALRSLPWIATFTANITAANGQPVYFSAGHTWSLGVEEQFYIVWPCLLLLIFLLARNRRQIVISTLVLAAASAVALLAMTFAGVGWRRLFNGTDMRAEELLVGAAAGMWLVWRRPKIPSRLAASVVVVWLATLALVSLTASPVGRAFYVCESAIAITTAAVLLIATSGPPPRLLHVAFANRQAQWVGRISYSVYLWHVPVAVLANRWYQPGNHVRTVGLLMFTIVGALALASCSYYAVERPFLRLKDTRFTSRVGLRARVSRE
jgi:peptidoglycan/LPS O-acetylase OafA/YrhL